jgi:hypothetical protein
MTLLLTGRPVATGPASPCCPGTTLSGGPVVYLCACGRDVHGSTLDHEVRWVP